MSNEPEVKTQDDVIPWIHAHRGRVDTLWEQQDRFNRQFREDMRIEAARLHVLETKVARIAAVAGAVGALVGAVGVQLFRWFLSNQGTGPL